MYLSRLTPGRFASRLAGGRRKLAAGLVASLGLLSDPAEAQYLKKTAGSFSTSSAAFTDVPGGALDVTPGSPADVWILLLSGRMRSTWTTSDEIAAEVRYLVNGTQRGLISIRNHGANPGGTFAHFDRVTGTTVPQTVKVQLRDGKATATLDNLVLVAFRLPAGADFQWADTLGVQSVPALAWGTMQSLSFTPASAGNYLVIALGSGREDPDSSTLGVRFQDPSGAFWPIDDLPVPPRRGQFENGRSGWPPFLLARVQNLTATPKTYSIEAQGDALGAEIRDTRIMAFRTDAFLSVQSVEDLATTTTTSTTPVVKSTLTTAAPPSARDHIVIQSLLLDADIAGPTDERRAGFERNDTVVASHGLVTTNNEFESSYSFFDAVTTASSMKLENTYSTSNAAYVVEGKESVIHVLSLASASCCDLQTAEGTGTITVTAPASFEMLFNTARGGGIDDFFDLAEDPSRTLYLAGKDSLNLFGLFHSSMTVGGLLYTSGTNSEGAKLDLLEATPARVKVRQESFYQRVLPATAILAGVKAIGDYSVYGTRAALRWNRKTTTGVLDQDDHPLEIAVRREAAGVLNPMGLYSQSGAVFPAPAGDDFVLAQREVAGSPGARTDFLAIQHTDWPAADTLTVSTTGAYFSWRDNTLNQNLAAGLDEKWNFLVHYKPTNFLDNTDPAVTTRSGDYRIPSATPVAVGAGWVDANENTASDPVNVFFNESEAAYVFDLNPATGLTFDLDGSAARYSPFFKIRQWRSLGVPATITVASVTKTRDVDYRAAVKPVARAHFAQDVLFYSTLETDAVLATPDVGNPGSSLGITHAPGRHGMGLDFQFANSYLQFPTTDFDKAKGAVEFWVRPYFASTDNAESNLAGFRAGPNDEWVLRKDNLNNLSFIIEASGAISQVTVSPANYSWRAYDWVHIRMEWDDSASLDLQQRIFLNGTEPANTNSGANYDSTALSLATNLRVGSYRNGAADALGLYDEVYSFGGSAATPPAPVSLARGGLTTDAREYLADGARNFTLSFAAVDGIRRGEYLYLGADSKFRGLNVVLATAGAGSVDLQWQYWDGAAWSSLETFGFADQTSQLTRNGNLYWTDPPAWAPYSLSGGPDLYYVRAYLASGAYAPAPREAVIKTDILLFQYCADVTAAATTFVFTPPVTTAVTLQSFVATAADAAVELSWSTASELRNLGFHVHRSTSPEGPWTRITSSLIPGLGSSPTGASYSYRDLGLSNGTTYFYELEDVETSGRTERHGPVSATPQVGSGDGSGSGSGGGAGDGSGDSGGPEGAGGGSGSDGSGAGDSGRITWGRPSGASLRVLERGSAHVVLELATPGFTATTQGEGTVRIFIPGFEHDALPGTLDVPVRHAFIEALAGRRARLASIEPKDLVSFDSFRLPAAGTRELVALQDGTLRTGSSPRPLLDSHRRAGFTPRTWARLLGSSFQGETKKVRLELSPLRHDPVSGRTLLAQRLVVRVEFTGTEIGERSLGGSRGRRPPTPTLRRSGVLAQLVARTPGLYRVRFEDLFASGQRGLPARTLRLSRRGIPVPYHMEPAQSLFAQGSSLFFVNDGNDPDPRGESVYELSRGEAAFMEEVSAAPSGPSTFEYVHTLTREENKLYQSALLPAPDLWLWDSLFSPVSKSHPFTVDALSPSSTSGRLKVVLQGGSDFPEMDHHLRLSVNGIPVGETTWDGMTERVVEVELSAGVLVEGTNTLALENVGDAGAAYSLVFLNRFEVSYPRLLAATGGRLEGRFEDSGRAELTGLAGSTLVVDTTPSSASSLAPGSAGASPSSSPVWLQDLETTPAGLAFRAEAGHRYLAVSESALLTPEVRRTSGSRLRNTSTRADWVLIAPREFLPAAGPLLELRRLQGLLPLAVATEDVFAEFGHGEARPQALRDFLAFAFHNWKTRPRYVVLLGDTTYDPRNFLGTGVKDRVPSPLLQTTYLWTVSDPSLAAVNGDDLLPDLAIGRLSAGTLAEAERLVAKLVVFEQAGRTFDGTAVLVADNADLAGSFEQNQDEIASTVLQGRDVEKVYLRDLGGATRTTIRAALDSGPGLLSYVGHGATAVWASENVWNNTDLASLQGQAQQPLLLTLNCLNGFFHFPPFDSLAEAFVKADGKGALAAFSPSGLSVNDPAHLYHKAVLAELTSGSHPRLGDALLAAQKAYADSGHMPELLSIYHLFGDPGMRIR